MSQGTPKRILLVDDDPEWLEVLRGLLRHPRHPVLVQTASNGAEALRLLTDIDLVVTDWEMPELDGVSMLKKIREQRPQLPVILQTGGFWDGGVQEKIVRKWGVAGFLLKHEARVRLLPLVLEVLGLSNEA